MGALSINSVNSRPLSYERDWGYLLICDKSNTRKLLVGLECLRDLALVSRLSRVIVMCKKVDGPNNSLVLYDPRLWYFTVFTPIVHIFTVLLLYTYMCIFIQSALMTDSRQFRLV